MHTSTWHALDGDGERRAMHTRLKVCERWKVHVDYGMYVNLLHSLHSRGPDKVQLHGMQSQLTSRTT